MTKNLLKRTLLSGGPSVGCWLTLASPAVAEALAHCNFDWLLVDAEHAPNDKGDTAAQLRAIDAARAHGAVTEAAVRVASNDPVLVKHAMDCGAQTIVFPSIETVDQARAAVAATRFAHLNNGGVRGIAGLVRAGRYGLDPEYTSSANQEACAVLQIETAEGLANVEAICAVEGADCLFIGPADLSASMGYLGQPDHAVVQQAIDRIIEVCKAQGKPVGIFAGSAEDAAQYRRRGVGMIALHSDVAWLTRGATRALHDFQQHIR